MATATKKFEFIALIPDKAGVREKRLSVRAQHFKEIAPSVDSGIIKMGGAMLNSVPESDDPNQFDFAGSAVVITADSKEHAVEQLKKDIYFTSGVWDMDKVQIIPYLNGFRRP